MKNSIEISNLEGLSKIINVVEQAKGTSLKLNKFLAEKSYEVLKKVTNDRIYINGNFNTNNEAINSYISHNKYEVNKDGFTLYNDMPRIAWKGINGNDYDFSVSLAFEFGTGIIGETNPAEWADKYGYQYNVNKYNFGWNYIDLNGDNQHTYGYSGMEIYRYTQIEIEKNIRSWINEYMMEVNK